MSVGNNSRQMENEMRVFDKDWLRVFQKRVMSSLHISICFTCLNKCGYYNSASCMSFNLIARNELDLTVTVENVRLQVYERPSYPQRMFVKDTVKAT